MSVLFEMEEDEWWEGVQKHDKSNPGYVDFVKWMKGRCFPTFQIADQIYKKRQLPHANPTK